MTDILIQPTADDDDVLTSAVVIDDGTLPLSNEDAVALGLTLGTGYTFRVLGEKGTLTITDVPAQMSAPTVTATGTTSISVDRAAAPSANGSMILSYDLRWSTDEATWTTVTDITDPHTVSSLTASTLYYVQTRALNANGAGAWSPSGTATTDAAAGYTLTHITPAMITTASIAIGDTKTYNVPINLADYSAGDEVLFRVGDSGLYSAATFNGNAADSIENNAGLGSTRRVTFIRYTLQAGDIGTTTTVPFVMTASTSSPNGGGLLVSVVSGSYSISLASWETQDGSVSNLTGEITPTNATNDILAWMFAQEEPIPVTWTSGMTKEADEQVGAGRMFGAARVSNSPVAAKTVTATFTASSSGAMGLVCINGV